jgi:hypothetical protein
MMPGDDVPSDASDVPEGLSAAEVGKEIAEHRERLVAHAHTSAGRHERLISIAEAVMLSVVAVLAAWSGYCAAKWSTESSVSLARASAARTNANRADVKATQIRTLDSVSFNTVFAAIIAGDAADVRVAERRLRPEYRPAYEAWKATDPLHNPKAPAGPSYMPQYRIPEADQARRLDAAASRYFDEGTHAGNNADRYVRLTVALASVLFVVGISSQFHLRTARYGLVAVATILLGLALAGMLSLPGPPS